MGRGLGWFSRPERITVLTKKGPALGLELKMATLLRLQQQVCTRADLHYLVELLQTAANEQFMAQSFHLHHLG